MTHMKPKITAMIIAVCTVLFGSAVAAHAQQSVGFTRHQLSRISGPIRQPDSSSVVQQGSTFVATYNADISKTLNGNDVTNVMIFEEDAAGHVRVVAYPNSLAPGGDSVLSDTLSFAPTATFIVGSNFRQPSDLTGKNHLVMFVNDAFTTSASGKEFSQAFAPLHEQAFLDAIQRAHNGDTNSMNLLKSEFENGPLHKAAFTSGGIFRVVSSSVMVVIPPTQTPVPEIDPTSSLSALTLLSGIALIIRARKK
jgi:hypothetical protein